MLLGCYLISIQNLIFTLEITRVLNWVFFLDICLPKPFSSSSANTFVGKSGFKNYLSPVEKKNKSCKNRQKSNYFNPHPEYSQNNLGIRILISITNLGQEIFQGHFWDLVKTTFLTFIFFFLFIFFLTFPPHASTWRIKKVVIGIPPQVK